MPTSNTTSNPSLDPFTPIETEPVSSPKGGEPPDRDIYLTGTAGDGGLFPGGGFLGKRRTFVGTVPAQKLLLSNQEVRTAAHEIAEETPWTWEVRLAAFDGQHLAYGLVSREVSIEVGDGDSLCLGLLFQNSYDGSWEPSGELFAYWNRGSIGLLHSQHFGDVHLLSRPSGAGWSTDCRRARRYLETGPSRLRQFARRCERLQERSMSASSLADLRRHVLSGLSRRRWGCLVDRFLHSPDLTAWGLLASGSALLWTRGGAFRHRVIHRNRRLSEAVLGHIPPEEPVGW